MNPLNKPWNVFHDWKQFNFLLQWIQRELTPAVTGCRMLAGSCAAVDALLLHHEAQCRRHAPSQRLHPHASPRLALCLFFPQSNSSFSCFFFLGFLNISASIWGSQRPSMPPSVLCCAAAAAAAALAQQRRAWQPFCVTPLQGDLVKKKKQGEKNLLGLLNEPIHCQSGCILFGGHKHAAFPSWTRC